MKGSWILGVLVIVLSLVQAGVGEEQGSARIRPGRPYWADQGRPIVTVSPSGQTLYVWTWREGRPDFAGLFSADLPKAAGSPAVALRKKFDRLARKLAEKERQLEADHAKLTRIERQAGKLREAFERRAEVAERRAASSDRAIERLREMLDEERQQRLKAQQQALELILEMKELRE